MLRWTGLDRNLTKNEINDIVSRHPGAGCMVAMTGSSQSANMAAGSQAIMRSRNQRAINDALQERADRPQTQYVVAG